MPEFLPSLESPAQAEPHGRDEFGLPFVQLSPHPTGLRFPRPPTSVAWARPLLHLVNARDCRRTARLVVWRGRVRLGTLDVRIPARWASWLLDLSGVLGCDPARWPEVLEVEVTAQKTLVGIRDSLLLDHPLPALIVGGEDRFAPTSAWVAVPFEPEPNPRVRALDDFLHTRGALDYLGWMVGCTTTGLWDMYTATGNLHFLETLKRRLASAGEGLPLEPGGPARLEAYVGEGSGSVCAVTLDSRLESFAPVAALTKVQRLEPTPEREAVLRASTEKILELIHTPRDFLTTEGCFTLAFPLAAIAKTLDEPEWLGLAAGECLERWDFLVRGDRVVQRAYRDGRTQMGNWARGIAWLVLGTAQTARELPPGERKELVTRLRQIAPWLRKHQRPDGLWNVFIDRPDTSPETSGSAGIAAGMAIAAKEGWLGSEARTAAERCLGGLESYLGLDGCLAGVSQHNPVGEETLQLGYRICSAWGTGLYAQLVAALMD